MPEMSEYDVAKAELHRCLLLAAEEAEVIMASAVFELGSAQYRDAVQVLNCLSLAQSAALRLPDTDTREDYPGK